MSQDNNNNHDGIIQRVIDSYMITGHNYKLEITSRDYNRVLTQIKQELIEKIKQEYEYNYHHTKEVFTTKRFMKKLIGDTQQ